MAQTAMNVALLHAVPADAARLAAVFNASFYADYLKYGECPGYGKTEADMLASIEGRQGWTLYKILADGALVGAVGVQYKGGGAYFLGALCVEPAYAGQGIGQRAMALLDKEYPAARLWTLETPADKSQNHYFYQKLGYRVTKEYMDGGVRIAYFERRRDSAAY